MRYLTFDLIDNNEGLTTIEALASTAATHHAAVMAEVRQLLDWAGCHFPASQGPADAGMDWDDDLLVAIEPGGWHTVALTLTVTQRFLDEFLGEFGHLIK